MNNTETITGPVWSARNWSADAGAGSIHDDATASDLGFRGGTVAGDVHMNQFPPVLLRTFGKQWFEQGALSLMFRTATVDQEKVRVFAQSPDSEQTQIDVWMDRVDGQRVCDGTASLGDHSASRLRTLDLRASDPDSLRILKGIAPGTSLGRHEMTVSGRRQFELFDAGLISDPLDLYRTGSPWNVPIACPSTIVQHLWRPPTDVLRGLIHDRQAVGLFGAIEITHVNGPLLIGQQCVVEARVVAVGESPQTETVWMDCEALDTNGRTLVTLRMLQRLMKASSKLYAETGD